MYTIHSGEHSVGYKMAECKQKMEVKLHAEQYSIFMKWQFWGSLQLYVHISGTIIFFH